MAILAVLNSVELISHKIWVVEKFSIFHTVSLFNCTLGSKLVVLGTKWEFLLFVKVNIKRKDGTLIYKIREHFAKDSF